ncbi:glycerate kinase [Demequina sp. TTPB684]|uniref:glycerate kinase n=1 Tax=unclassified Demequina TaxID=2620311 RepID=UPI001CF1DB97|nr:MULTISPECIES: glycerate kinase [unclassified Demequina]MCB2411876.1 glycerate kinase [Demequina sp. TTPB684]UPU87614.1 glycerate kinase [Demequina sp. TMPB413]
MRVAIAPDSFKGSIAADAAARAIADGWLEVRPSDDVELMPQADGGEGTLDAIEACIPGAQRRGTFPVDGPDGRPTRGEWLVLPDGVAVVELAQMCGLPLMAEHDALRASTRGFGQTIGAALDAGATRLVLALGGSASTDGGAGALMTLGLRLTDASGAPLGPGGAALADLHMRDNSELRPPPPGGVTMLTDVTAPLLGPEGAAEVFGPQKGASSADVQVLDAALRHYALVLGGDLDARGAGAAGGTAFGFATLWGARIESGAAYIQRLTGLSAALAHIDLVITGEGRYDAQSSGGKVVGEVLTAAGRLGTRAAVIAGQVAEQPPVQALSLIDLAGSGADALARPAFWLRAAGAAAAAAWGEG